MKILNLFIDNYGSFSGRHCICLADRGLVSVLGENQDDPRNKSNGAGKSTWADALDWAFFGEIPRGDAAHTVVNDQSKGCCVTVLVTDDDGHLLKITRTRDYNGCPNGPKFWVDDLELTALDAKETQKVIEKHLGLDRIVFHAAVLFAQTDTFKFADATDAQRKEVLARILPELVEVDSLLEVASYKYFAAVEDSTKALSELDHAEVKLASARQQDPTPRVANWEQQRTQELARLQAEGEAAVKEMRDLQNALPAVIPPPKGVPPLPSYSKVTNSEIEYLDKEAKECGDLLQSVRIQASEVWKRLDHLSKVTEGDCSQCGQKVTADHLHRERMIVKSRFDTLKIQDTKLYEKYATLAHQSTLLQRDLERSFETIRAKEHAERDEIIKHNANVDALKRENLLRAQQANAAAQRAVVLDGRAQQLKAQINPEVAYLAKWQSQVKDLEEKLAKQQDAVRVLALREQALTFWKVGLGARGLKSYVLDGRIAEMAAEANRWVQLLTGGTVWVEFSTQKEVGKGKQKKYVEEFSIKVIRSNPDGTVTDRNYRSWSGGEKYRIALGIDFGLARLVAKRAKHSYDLLILDEFMKALDSSGREAVAEMLVLLAKEKSSIFVIDHDPQFQNMFDQYMVVRKKNRRSFVVGNDGLDLSEHSAFPRGIS